MFSGITCMNRFFYVEEILRNALLPFVNATFPDNSHRFQQDNDCGKAHKKVIFITPVPPVQKTPPISQAFSHGMN